MPARQRLSILAVVPLLALLAITLATLPQASAAEPAADAAAKVSYYKQIRPIFQANCQGCHQPAKAKGEYLMTSFAALLQGGESGSAAIVPGKPAESYLIEEITPEGGEAEMPKGKKPLHETEIALITKWIAEGARDDTPASARTRFTMENPPQYTRPPVITSMDYSPDGKLLAISAFHEVLLVTADGNQLVARLVGMSERIESVRFSPDGKRLAVAGGLPARMGEVQVWDVAKKQLLLSKSMTFDTLYGASWSPDGKLIAVGCPDNTVRAIDSTTGEQVLFQGAHSDWVRDTVFSTKGTHVVSVGRDMSSKLTEVATQRFVDNVSSITPGALKGGVQTVARHPQRDEIVIGGADGVVKVYRMFRLTKRVIGDDANLIRRMPEMDGRVFGVSVSPDGKRIAAVSSLNGHGQLHVYSYEFDTSLPANIKKISENRVQGRSAADKATLETFRTKDTKLIAQLALPGTPAYAVSFSRDSKAVAIAGGDGLVRIVDAASGSVINEFSPVALFDKKAGMAAAVVDASHVDFIRDVNPVLSKLGCNAGTCHGSAKGKNGFKLSLRGYDAIFDVRALTDDLASRRVNVASPDDSLMLLKTAGGVPHQGGALIKPDDKYYKLIRQWIASGARLNLEVPRVTGIEVSPLNPVIEKTGGSQQMQVVAKYSNGQTRDVTAEAFVVSGNTEVATIDENSKMTALRRGESAVLARYEGAYAATTLTVMGDRSGFVWEQPETWGKVDELVAAKWKRMKIIPSELTNDAQFVRRVYLDLTGLPPTVEQTTSFIDDPRGTRIKRDELIDKLVGSEEFVEFWTNKWADLLQVNRKFLGAAGAASFRQWIRKEVEANTPYDKLVHKIVTASGSNRENPAASYYKILREPVDIMENTTHLFLGVRFNCNKCHDHPFERWTQDQYYETAAYFAQVDLKRDPASKGNIGGTAVEGAKPLYEVVSDKKEGEVMHDRTRQVAAPEFPFEAKHETVAQPTRRQQMAAWLTSAHNPYFARSYANRLWGYMTGTGIIEPIDDIRAGNPATNPQLLDHLTSEFVGHKFDVQHMMKVICKSRTYQLSIATNKWNEDDSQNYSHAKARRLPAEVLYDAIHRVTGSVTRMPGVPAGTRASALPDSGVQLKDGFLANLGRPPRESSCECERANGLELGPVMALISGPTVGKAVSDPANAITKIAAEAKDDADLVNRVFLRVLNRPATKAEISSARQVLESLPAGHQKMKDALAAYESKLAPSIQAAEAKRSQAIATAKTALDAYAATVADREKMLDMQHASKLAAAEAALKDYQSKLPQKQAAWEAKAGEPTTWQALDPSVLKASNRAKLTKEKDLSIFASGPNGKGAYTFTAAVPAGVTGVKLELFADSRLPSKGPGRPPNGNFVLTELTAKWAQADSPQKTLPVKLQNAQADYSQDGYPVASAIDGKVAATGNGWASSPQLGVNRTAVFETVADVDDGLLTFILDQQYQDGKHSLGRFRISVTTSPRPIKLKGGLPANIGAILKVEVAKRDAGQKKQLADFHRSIDGELKKLQLAVANAKKPRVADGQLKKLQDALAAASMPLPVDPKLTRMRNELQLSASQLEKSRLTIAQDLAWALINTPSFLFNR